MVSELLTRLQRGESSVPPPPPPPKPEELMDAVRASVQACMRACVCGAFGGDRVGDRVGVACALQGCGFVPLDCCYL